MAIAHKTCLITGCSSGGVGAALAEAFMDKGYHVFATARSTAKVPQRLHDASKVTVLALDVSSSESIVGVAEAIEVQTKSKLDVLINNAGLGLEMPVLDTSVTEARKVFDVNFFGALEMIQVFSPMLIKAEGCIYQATKAALIQAGDVLRLELAPMNVRVLTLVTGGITTNFLANLPTLVLPENSYYHGIKHIIQEKPEKVPFGASPESFAREVLCQVEKGTTGKYWIGGVSGFARLALWLFPEWLLDRFSLGQKQFTKELAEEHKKRVEQDKKRA
ncbi:hypothetical protein VN97_g9942 [Penicillium thymicola]|uniref:NAD(P)-binding protein n=1 Tax=Penicillium thymicola TaxID=293382 RepID=A0AAI9T9X4_PENTH|nr:hypothetical protein VN97_g9942 [Penicillium thymicola]